MTAADLKLRSNLKQRGGYWIVGLSWYDKSGKRKQTNITTGLPIVGNKRKAEQREKEICKELERKLLTETSDAEKILFSDWLRKWLVYIEKKVSPSTFYGYRIVVERHIIPYFESEGISLTELTRKKIEGYYSHRQETSRVSTNSIKHEASYIHSSLKYAVREGLLPFNPADDVQLPKMQRHQANTFTAEQLKTFLSSIKDSELEPAILIAAWFGLRRGEIIGLKWACIDTESKTLSVRGTMKSQGKDGYSVYYVPSAKNATSIRTLPMTDEQADYFAKLKEFQKRRQRVPGYCHDYDDFVCTYKDGKIISPNTLTRAVPKLCEACGLPRLKLHELRHTCISLLIQNGETILEAAEWAGHSTPTTTANIYAHLDVKSKEKASKILAGLLA